MNRPPTSGLQSRSLSALQQRLGEVTRVAHQRVNHHPLLRCLTRSDLTSPQYRRALQALYAINAPTELRLAEYVAAQGVDFAYEARRRMRELAADIVFLGGSLPAPVWPGPQIDSVAGLIGVMYVLEGSRLGGQVVARQVAISLGLSATAGIKFMSCCGQSAAQLWAEFGVFAAVNCPETLFPVAEQAALGYFSDLLTQLDRLMEADGAA
jgi:heme oxygenase